MMDGWEGILVIGYFGLLSFLFPFPFSFLSCSFPVPHFVIVFFFSVAFLPLFFTFYFLPFYPLARVRADKARWDWLTERIEREKERGEGGK
ncbi:hypothetical protein HOY82DRAFT_339473 [Tuber indicum]|nr:hypothetical protein HOY82DRAFT_339473 [Tuber indicum]